jgi:hypothetical protein
MVGHTPTRSQPGEERWSPPTESEAGKGKGMWCRSLVIGTVGAIMTGVRIKAVEDLTRWMAIQLLLLLLFEKALQTNGFMQSTWMHSFRP